MSRISEYIERTSKEWREQHFKEHHAILHEVHPSVAIINWQKLGTWNYGCRFIIHRRWLCVVGDIGEATYEWSQDLTLEFLGSLNFGYFAGKCRASEQGRKYESWDSSVAEECRLDRVNELLAIPEDDRSDNYDEELDALNGMSRPAQADCQDAGADLYKETGDSDTASEIADLGKVPDQCCIGHFIGLQMAIAKLNAKSAA